MDRIVEPKVPAPRDTTGQAERYARMLGLQEEAVTVIPETRKFGHMGVAIVGGYIWPGWSQSREIFEINPYSPSVVTGADILRGQELAAEHGW